MEKKKTQKNRSEYLNSCKKREPRGSLSNWRGHPALVDCFNNWSPLLSTFCDFLLNWKVRRTKMTVFFWGGVRKSNGGKQTVLQKLEIKKNYTCLMDDPHLEFKISARSCVPSPRARMFSCFFACAMMVLLELPREEYASGFRGML